MPRKEHFSSPIWPLALDCTLAQSGLSLSPVSENRLWEDSPDIRHPKSMPGHPPSAGMSAPYACLFKPSAWLHETSVENVSERA